MDEAFETIYAILDWWDGPVEGIADFRGAPHYFLETFDEVEDDFTNLFLLKPLDAAAFQMAMEIWEIWLRWIGAYNAGETTLETHPALPYDRERYNTVQEILKPQLTIVPEHAVHARAHFLWDKENTRFITKEPSRVRWIPE